MSKYLKLHNEFLSFLKSIQGELHDEYETIIANLILNHFDEIAEAGKYGGKRAKLLNTIIQEEGASASSVLQIPRDSLDGKVFPFERLDSLKVQDFRGFSTEETIPFDKKYTLIYGPNGSGKSSLCEALEYMMLGYINEAISKRIDIDTYITNSFTGRAATPILIGRRKDQDAVRVKPDSSLYHFCFIEKSRIEDFARISANTPNEKQNLLASLFGLDEFNDFVGNFTENIEKFIMTEGSKALELQKKSQGLAIHQQNILNDQKNLTKLEEEKKSLASKENISFKELLTLLHGDQNNKGRLFDLEKLLSGPPLVEYPFPDINEIQHYFNELEGLIGACKEISIEYERNRDKVKFRDLFKTVIQVENQRSEICPVCETPTESATKHPYVNARKKLKELSEIAALEQRLQDAVRNLVERLKKLEELLNKRKLVSSHISLEYPGPELRITFTEEISALGGLVRDFENAKLEWNQTRSFHLELDSKGVKHNTNARKLALERKNLSDERTKLLELLSLANELTTREKTISENISRWQKEIANFKVENATLIAEVKAEKENISFNKKYVDAYKKLRSRLHTYKDALPIQHLEKLNNLALELYNTINIHDRTFEKASGILLPTSKDDSIKITFIDNPDEEHDALHILSEGHIRCLGLAILLAKNIHDGCPVVIFDDVVNAIDTDHRGGVRQAIFTNSNLANKQIILTTHAEEFIKELELHPTKSEYVKHVRKFTFIPDTQERLIRINYDTHQNYLFKAECCCESAQWSEALYNCRCSLENVSCKLWNKLSRKKFKTEFSVVIRSPNGKPDLMSVVLSMNKFLKKVDTNQEFQPVLNVFDYLLGLETSSDIVWTYLNKGAHDETGRIEFDELIVKQVCKRLTDLDEFVKTC